MSQIEKLYEAYCKEQENTPIAPEELHFNKVLAGMISHKEYLEIEALINNSHDERDKEFFFAGFRAATRMWTEAMK